MSNPLVETPLEWSERRDGCVEAVTPFGSYRVEPADREIGILSPRWSYCFDEYYDEGQFECASVDEGKTLAQAHWDERVGGIFRVRATPPAAVPEGWVMVPRKLTPGMIHKAQTSVVLGETEDGSPAYLEPAEIEKVFQALLAAAPPPPTEGDGWQPIETAPKDRPIAIEYKSGSGWKVTGAQWNKYKRLWGTPFVTLLPHEIARWHELPNGLENPDAKSPAENSDD